MTRARATRAGRTALGVTCGAGLLALCSACAGAAPTSPQVTKASSNGSADIDAAVVVPPETEAPAASASAAVPAPPGPLPTGGSVLIGDIVAPPSFDPKPTLTTARSAMVDCYDRARQETPSLRGKVSLRINVGEAGKVMLVEGVAGGSANDPVLVACLSDALKALTFPKPGGLAIVTAPLVFRP